MTALAVLIACFTLGLALPRVIALPEQTPAVLNAWVLNLALPALILHQIPMLELSRSLLFAAATPWAVFLGAWALIAAAARRHGWDRGTTGALILTCGLGNTAFIGFAMIPALLGPAALGAAIVADQFGSFLALSTAAAIAAAWYGGGETSAREIARRVLSFPPFLALLAALILRAAGGVPAAFDEVLLRIGETLAPIALFSVAMQLRIERLAHIAGPLSLGLGWKLLVAPVLILGAGAILQPDALVRDTAILQAAMAPMVTGGVLAVQRGLNPRLANTVVGIGIPLSFLTVPAWNWVLGVIL